MNIIGFVLIIFFFYYGEVVCFMCERMIFVNSKVVILIKVINN